MAGLPRATGGVQATGESNGLYVLTGRRQAQSPEEVLEDIRRLAAEIRPAKVTYDRYIAQGIYSINTVVRFFGSWNAALQKAGCDLSNRFFSRDESLAGIKAVWDRLGRRPTYDEYRQLGRELGYPGISTVEKHFGTYLEALNQFVAAQNASDPSAKRRVLAVADRPHKHVHLTGKPTGYEGMVYEPTCENGVIFLFGRLSEELGFVVESVRPGFPDCAGKRLDRKTGRYRPVRIEFELKSADFKAHRHPVDGCDLIVAWAHNWKDCPLEVLALKDYLARRSKGAW